jgi:hypothetical protein
MHQLFWIFCTFLVILTLISTFGGGIRYKENFIDEVVYALGDIKRDNMHVNDGLSNDILVNTLKKSALSLGKSNNVESEYIDAKVSETKSSPALVNEFTNSVHGEHIDTNVNETRSPTHPMTTHTHPMTTRTHPMKYVKQPMHVHDKTHNSSENQVKQSANDNKHEFIIEAFDGEAYAVF